MLQDLVDLADGDEEFINVKEKLKELCSETQILDKNMLGKFTGGRSIRGLGHGGNSERKAHVIFEQTQTLEDCRVCGVLEQISIHL